MTAEKSQSVKLAETAVWRLLKIRGRSEQEIRDRLKRKNFSESVIQQTLRYFREAGFLDDRRFARDWTQARLNRPFGLNRIRMELVKKGIASDLVRETLDQAKEEQDELAVVCKLIERRKAHYEGLEPLKAKQRLFGFLSRKGFSTGTIIKAIKEWNKRS